MQRRRQPALIAVALSSMVGACMSPTSPGDDAARPNVAPKSPPNRTAVVQLDRSRIEPMYRELLAINLATVARVALADNIEVLQARQQIEAAHGRLESTVGGLFPTINPGATFEHVQGTVRNVEGALVPVGFNTFQMTAAVQWIINPGRAVYEVVAARKRLDAARSLERGTAIETLRTAAVQYYDIALAQTRVAAAQQAREEARELVRINELRVKTGSGIQADLLLAQSRLAGREQDLTLALDSFNVASIQLANTLRLDPAVTLVPSADELRPVELVTTDLDIEQLVGLAAQYRPDFEAVRTLAAASASDRSAIWWGAWGLQGGGNYQVSGITGHADNVVEGQGIPNNLILNPRSDTGQFSPDPFVNGYIKEGISRLSKAYARDGDATFGMSTQQRAGANVGWRFSLSVFGDMRAARAAERQAILEAERQLDRVRADVVLAHQASRTQEKLIENSARQLAAAAEALRLAKFNLQVGSMTTLHVLQAQEEADRARVHHAQSIVRYNQAQVNLLAAIGLLEESVFNESLRRTGRKTN